MTIANEAGAPTARPGWADAPWLRLPDFAALLWSERKLVLGIGGAICALGLAAALVAPHAYTARAELLVRMGEAYVYQPTAGGQSAGAGVPTQAKSLRWPIMIVTLLLAAIIAPAAGLSRGLMRRSFPTAAAAARALNAPVLAILPQARPMKRTRAAKPARPPKGKPSLILVEGGAS